MTGERLDTAYIDVLESMNDLLELHLVRVASGASTLDVYAEPIKEQLRTDINNQGLTLEAVARKFQEDIEPSVKNGLMIVYEADIRASSGGELDDSDLQTMQRFLGRSAFRGCLAKILFLRAFRRELPEEVTSWLDEYPRFSFTDILEQNQAPATDTDSVNTAAVYSGEPAGDRSPDVKVADDPESEAEATGAGSGTFPQEENSLTGYKAISAEKLLSLDPSQVEILERVKVTIGGNQIKTTIKDVYVLAMLRASAGQEIKLLDYIQNPLVEAIAHFRGDKDKSGKTNIYNTLQKLRKLAAKENWPAQFVHNGKRTGNSRYTLEGDPSVIEFYLDEDLPEETSSDLSHIEQLPTDIQERISNIFDDTGSRELIEKLLSVENGLPLGDVTAFFRGDLDTFLKKLMLFVAQPGVKGLFQIDTGTTSGKLSIRRADV